VAATRHAAASDSETAALVPEPLLPYLGRGLAHLAWRGVGRMFEEAPVRTTLKGFKASLMRLKPGAEMPVHTHRGTEYTLVLAGGFKDNGEQFARGDFAYKDSSHEHRPVVDTGGPCLCLVVLDAPVKLTSAMGRLVNPFLRI
jgi:putative transcriptional regulator